MTPPYKAPEFSANGVALKDFAGKWVILYFYPKDDTPGCTTQACSLRDARDDLTELGAEVIGVSKDDAASHDAFKAKHNLNFHLVSDPEREIIEAYGAWNPDAEGLMRALRKTFLIDPEGMVQKVYENVIPDGHGSQVVEDLRELQK